MEKYYEGHRRYQEKVNSIDDFNSPFPSWAKKLVELYMSPLKYEIMYELDKENLSRKIF